MLEWYGGMRMVGCSCRKVVRWWGGSVIESYVYVCLGDVCSIRLKHCRDVGWSDDFSGLESWSRLKYL